MNCFGTTNVNNRTILEQLKQLFVSNNTAGATIYELGELVQTDSLGTLNNALKQIETKAEERRLQEQQAAQQAQEAEIKARQQEKQLMLDHESREKEKDRRNRLLEAEIKAAGYGAQQDINQNQESDFKDSLDNIHKRESYQSTMNFNREKEGNRTNLAQQKLDLEKQKLNQEVMKRRTELEIARENKNRYDKKPTKD